MTTDSRFDSAVSAVQRGFKRVAAGIAGLSFWQFVLLAIILLAAAGISEGLWESPAKQRIHITKHRTADKRAAAKSAKVSPSAEIQIDEDGVHIRRKPGSAGTPALPPASSAETGKPAAAAPAPGATDSAGNAKGSSEVQVQIPDIGLSEADLAELADIEDINLNAKTRRPPLVTIALLLVLALFVMRLFARTQQKADAAVAVADRETLQRQVVEARLQLLQAQVEPHFLFNTLAAVEYLIETAPARAAQMQRHLIEYLRAALPRMRQQSATLGQEVELCASYLKIMQMRMEERLQFDVAVPAGLSSASFPPMMIQSLVENAIQHGLEPKPEGGSVHLRAEVRDGKLCVSVEDTGMGFSADAGAGIGLANIRERLQQLFGAAGALTMEPNSPSGTRATITVPYAVA
jgi:signal transduction histidine kinase